MTIKLKIIKELEKSWFPNLDFIFSNEALAEATSLLEKLLKIEKEKFKKLLNIENKNLTFDSFENESYLDYFWNLLNHFKSVNNTETIRTIIENFRPQIEDFYNYISYNQRYFEQIEYINDNIKLDQEQKRIIDLRLKAFKDRWINLSQDRQDRLKELNKELAKLEDAFSNNLVDDESKFEYLITDFNTIKELPKEVLDIAKQKNKDSWLFDANYTFHKSIMSYCSDKGIRKDFDKAHNSFASTWKYDNRPNVLKILKLKKEKADILGHNNFAELSLNTKMAESPQQIFELIEWISTKARLKATEEINTLKSYFKLDKIDPEDLAYYSRIYKEKKYDINEKELKKYFEFENTLYYLQNFISDFFGIELKETDIISYNKDVKIYEVYKDKKLISYYLLDAFYRKSKKTWAWANNLRKKTYIGNIKKPLIINVCNFQKNEWKSILSMSDIETLFHEFWHALHEISSQSKYSELSWFWVERDFVELPSQLLENWVSDRESLKKLAKHVDTWNFITDDILNKLDDLKLFGTWPFIARQNELALLDMKLYSTNPPNSINELDKLTLEIIKKYSIFNRDLDYKMYCSFLHIFWGGYSAWYYSYIWAEIIEADVFSKIKKEWMFKRNVWEKLLNTIIWQWTRKIANELFFDFMWRKVDNTAFIKRKWLQ